MSRSSYSSAAVAPGLARRWSAREWAPLAAVRRMPPELAALLVLAAVLNLWALSRNGWANEYYSAAVRSMSSSWHDFLYGSLDRSGVMTVDKPPLSLWVQALSVRVFGYHPLSMLVPQALMGVASVALVFDLVRRVFGRLGGFAAGLALALTPIAVAVSRHNNPDALLVLCSVGALWFALRGLENGRARWIVLSGVCVGLGFEAKMGVALVVVPGIAAAWLWIAPAGRGRWHALRQLLGGGAAMVAVGGAWPALVELTPAADRPWVSGTSDNRVLSLIFEYNGLGRVDGQTGGPGGNGMGGTMFGGSAGPSRLLNAALGGQVGWLLGFAAVGGLAILASSRLRRAEERSGWLVAVGGAFLVTAMLFSFAGGIFHPYYVSLLAPFVAALFGAGFVQLIDAPPRVARLLAPLAIAAGVAVELVVRSRYPGQLDWLVPLLPPVGLLSIAALLVLRSRIARLAALGAVTVALLAAPGVWAFDTLSHPASGTFPAGGPASAEQGRGPGGSPALARRGSLPGAPFAPGRAGPGPGGGGALPSPEGALPGGPPSAAPGQGGLPSARRLGGRFGSLGAPGGGGPGGFGDSASLTRVVSYVKQRGGGTIAVESQSAAASPIVRSGAEVAGIGGFSGRESDVSVAWLAGEVAAGRIRWVLDEGGARGGAKGRRLPGDTRTGSRAAVNAAARACTPVSLPTTAGLESATTASLTLYDCRGRAVALARTAG